MSQSFWDQPPFKPGDVVQCKVRHYASVDHGELVRVDKCRKYRGNDPLNRGRWVIEVTHMPPSNYCQSSYFADNFASTGRTVETQPKGEAKSMLSIALLVPKNMTPHEFCRVVARQGWETSPDTEILSANNENEMKIALADRIRQYPDERWIILSATAVAQISAPPVQFTRV